jgi:dephospho-CoA kinase
MNRDNLSQSQYDNRMKTQLSLEFKLEHSNYVIENEDDEDRFDQVKQVYEKIIKKNCQ